MKRKRPVFFKIIPVRQVVIILALAFAITAGCKKGNTENWKISSLGADFQFPAAGGKYLASNVFDGNANTCWGTHTGKSVISLLLDHNSSFDGIYVVNGAPGTEFSRTSRVKTLAISTLGAYIDGPQNVTVNLKDAPGKQYIDLEKTLSANQIILKVEDTYPAPGGITCLTEIELAYGKKPLVLLNRDDLKTLEKQSIAARAKDVEKLLACKFCGFTPGRNSEDVASGEKLFIRTGERTESDGTMLIDWIRDIRGFPVRCRYAFRNNELASCTVSFESRGWGSRRDGFSDSELNEVKALIEKMFGVPVTDRPNDDGRGTFMVSDPVNDVIIRIACVPGAPNCELEMRISPKDQSSPK